MRAQWWSRNAFVDAILKARPRCRRRCCMCRGSCARWPAAVRARRCTLCRRALQPTSRCPARTPTAQVALEEGAGRRVIFSTFDPDCATLLSLKQPRFPVLFLTCGGTKTFTVRAPRLRSGRPGRGCSEAAGQGGGRGGSDRPLDRSPAGACRSLPLLAAPLPLPPAAPRRILV